MDKNTNEPLVGSDKGKFSFDPKELADIVNLDNHYQEEKHPEFPTRTISSGMIIEKFNGVESIMAGLNSKPKMGIPTFSVPKPLFFKT